MSHFRLHTKIKGIEYRKFLMFGLVCLMAAGTVGYGIHSIGQARARSRETVLIFTEEEFTQYLVDHDSEEYNLNGRYRLEDDLDLSGLEASIGTNVEPFTGNLDGNGHVIRGLARPLFGVMKTARVENLFLGDARIQHPFTYSDGEHYTDGYGALTAYALDSEIRNCGMSGEIRTASPVEAEYQLAKATPADAEEMGPGAQGPAGMEDVSEESSPAAEGNEAGAGGMAGSMDHEAESEPSEVGPGVESGGEKGSVETESTAEVGPGIETDANTGNADATESSVQESQAVTSPSTDQNEATEPEQETAAPETETSQSSDSSQEPGKETEAESTKVDSEGEGEESQEKPAETGTDHSKIEGTEPGKEAGSEPAKDTGAEPVKETDAQPAKEAQTETIKEAGVEAAMEETIGFRSNDRQHLLMKIPEVLDVSMEELQTATPSDATPSDAAPGDSQGASAESSEEHQNQDTTSDQAEPEYIGNPEGDIYILVTAKRITAGGLAAETGGSTLIADSFALVTIDSDVWEVDTYAGGMTGIVGQESRLENSYTAGLVDARGVAGGFAAFHQGTIQNSYSSMTIGKRGHVRGAFAAMGEGTLSGCVYDRQMACVEPGNESEWEDAQASDMGQEAMPVQAEETEYGLKGLNTSEMTGPEAKVPGDWYTAEHAYPQIPYFSIHEHEILSSGSRASAISLVLPDGLTLADVLEEGGVTLPSEIDGREISWQAEGGIRIDEHNKIMSESRQEPASMPEAATISRHEAPEVGSALNTPAEADESVEMVAETGGTTGAEETAGIEETTGTDTGGIQLSGSIGGVTRSFALNSVQAAAAETYADWAAFGAGMASKGRTLSGGGTEQNPYQISTPEDMALFVHKVNVGLGVGLCAKLTKNIDLSGSSYSTGGSLTWSPIKNYEGIFDGDNHYFENVSIVSKDISGAGIFGNVQNGGVIKNLGVESGNIDARSYARCGAITGVLWTGSVINCWNKVDITNGGHEAAGLIGYIYQEVLVENCYNLGNVTSSHINGVGGIVGASWEGNQTIRNCYNLGKLNGNAGGILGTNHVGNVTIENCYNAGQTTSGGKGIFLSQATVEGSVKIENCYIDKTYSTDPLATALTTEQLQSWSTVQALNRENVNGPWKYTVGQYPSFKVGDELNTPSAPPDWSLIGQGLVEGTITTGKLTEGDGSTGSPYQIATAEQLAQFAYLVNQNNPGLCAELTADINLFGSTYTGITYSDGMSTTSALRWIPIASGSSGYTGTFTGNGHTISFLYAEDTTGTIPQGLFGVMSGNGKVTRTGLRKSVIKGKEAGGIAGKLEMSAEISQSFIRESSLIYGNGGSGEYCGGIAGRMNGTSTIKDCYYIDGAIGGVGTNSYAGRIAGAVLDGCGIYNSYAANVNIENTLNPQRGRITAYNVAGGTIIEQCYADVPAALYPADQNEDIKMFVTTTDADIQASVDDLNTTISWGNGERTGDDRVWYTSLSKEATGGWPTLKAPEKLAVTVDPAAVALDTSSATPVLNGSKGTVAGAALPSDVRLRCIQREHITDQEYVLTSKTDVSSMYLKYGSTDANKNLALAAGTKDLMDVNAHASLRTPEAAAQVGGFTELTLYAGGAYIYPTDRTFLIDLAQIPASGEPTRYELRVTVKGVTGKTLSVVLGTPGTIELSPGESPIAYTPDLKLENQSSFPITANIVSVTEKEVAEGSIDVKLKPIDAVIDHTQSMVAQGIRLGIVSPDTNTDTGNIGDQKFYYKPTADGSTAPSAASWITSEMEGKQTLWYRYFMEYSHLYQGPGGEKFGYDIRYQFQIPETNVDGITVAAN